MRSFNLPAAALCVAQLNSAFTLHSRRDNALDSPEVFEHFSKYSQAGYCDELTDGSVNTSVCVLANGSPCPNFQNVKTVKEFTKKGYLKGFKTGSYIATDPDRKEIVVVFKPTDPMTPKDIKVDIMKNQVNSDLCDGCKIHEGFSLAFEEVRHDMESTVKSLMDDPKHQGWRVVATGYSLGAALATLMSVQLRKANIKSDLYTYGSPRVGNPAFVKYATSQSNMGFSARIANREDTVTLIPTQTLAQELYEHIFPLYWYQDGLVDNAAIRAQDWLFKQLGVQGANKNQNRYTRPFTLCKDGKGACEPKYCGLTALGCNVLDHLKYTPRGFSGCATKKGRKGKGLDNDQQSEEEQEQQLRELVQLFVPEANNQTTEAV